MAEDEKEIRNVIENPKYKPQRVAPRKGKTVLSFIEPLQISVYSMESGPESTVIHLSIENKHPENDLLLFSVNLSMNSTARDFDGDSAQMGSKGQSFSSIAHIVEVKTKRHILRFLRRESTNIRSFEWSFSKSLLKEREILVFSCDRNNSPSVSNCSLTPSDSEALLVLNNDVRIHFNRIKNFREITLKLNYLFLLLQWAPMTPTVRLNED